MILDKACKQISTKLNIDYDIVKQVVQFLFGYVKLVMEDPDDYRDILINNLFRFKLKKRFSINKTKQNNP